MRISLERTGQGYMTGDVHIAKAALLQEEKLVAEHEARGNRGVDYRAVRLVLYGQLCGLSAFMGDTNEAMRYHAKYAENLKDSLITFEELLAAAEKHDQMLKPTWRKQ